MASKEDYLISLENNRLAIEIVKHQIAFWKKHNSQSDPAASAEYMVLRKNLEDYQKSYDMLLDFYKRYLELQNRNST